VSRYYRVCPECGAHLDPNEICEDCREKNRGARAANTDAPQAEDTKSIYFNMHFPKNQSKETDI
jgi:predicted amidophosphoribosyltransferase